MARAASLRVVDRGRLHRESTPFKRGGRVVVRLTKGSPRDRRLVESPDAFHDLRREFGSRVLESGSSLIEARDPLGHANIRQTSTYLQSTAKALDDSLREFFEHPRLVVSSRHCSTVGTSDSISPRVHDDTGPTVVSAVPTKYAVMKPLNTLPMVGLLRKAQDRDAGAHD